MPFEMERNCEGTTLGPRCKNLLAEGGPNGACTRTALAAGCQHEDRRFSRLRSIGFSQKTSRSPAFLPELRSIFTPPTPGLRRHQRISQLTGSPFEHALGDVPSDAGVGDGDAVLKFGHGAGEGMAAFVEEAFNHHADEGFGPGGALFDEAAPDFFLAGVLLAGIGVAAIDH